MKVITAKEAADWCKTHGIIIAEWGLPDVRRGTPGTVDFTIPNDAGQRTAMVKQQMAGMLTTSSCLIWLNDWDVWPSGQWHHLFERFRISYGCDEPLIAKPAHLIDSTEPDAAVSIAVYAVLMLWDCYVVMENGRWLYYSHDECGRISK